MEHVKIRNCPRMLQVEFVGAESFLSEQMSKNKNLNSDHCFPRGLLKRWPSLK